MPGRRSSAIVMLQYLLSSEVAGTSVAHSEHPQSAQRQEHVRINKQEEKSKIQALQDVSWEM